ncbi:MAG: tRNA-dihydrouridine synthase family protein [Deltaproteobacteria bacterium]|nr:tRNA-dihydrouridine synthase family protein [Deltaproteobacteria bacterium]
MSDVEAFLSSGVTFGGLSLPSRFLLAPLEGVSDIGFRRLCFEQGAALTYTEMLRARGLAQRNRATLDLIDTHHPAVTTGVQLLATSPDELLAALGVLEQGARGAEPHWQNIVAVDLNFGCPSRDVIQQGAGPALLKRRARIGAIIDALARWKTTTTLPIKAVSIKIRLGLNAKEAEHRVYLPVVEMASSARLDWITVHARHAGQRSRDKPDWTAIGEAKKVATIPVVGNGDVRTRDDARRLHEATGCDAFLIARAAIGSPWAFRALRGQGAADAAAGDIERERVRYDETAARVRTKDKYRQFHGDNFARLLAAARGERAAVVVPKNAHM